MFCFLLAYLEFQVYVCWLHSMCVCCVLSLYCILFYLIWLLWEINGSFYFWGVMCFVHFTILKMCVHEEYHLVLICHDYLVSMWYIVLMKNSNSWISINHLLLDFICLLLRVNDLSHYGGVICHVHIPSLENVNMWSIAT